MRNMTGRAVDGSWELKLQMDSRRRRERYKLKGIEGSFGNEKVMTKERQNETLHEFVDINIFGSLS